MSDWLTITLLSNYLLIMATNVFYGDMDENIKLVIDSSGWKYGIINGKTVKLYTTEKQAIQDKALGENVQTIDEIRAIFYQQLNPAKTPGTLDSKHAQAAYTQENNDAPTNLVGQNIKNIEKVDKAVQKQFFSSPSDSVEHSKSEPTLSECIRNSQLERARVLSEAGKASWIWHFREFAREFSDLLASKSDSLKAKDVFLNKYKRDFGIIRQDLNFSFEESSGFFKERVLCIAFNKCKNHYQLQQFLEREKSKIISKFAPEQYKQLDPNQFEVDITYVKGDTHHGGQSPAEITFKLDQQKTFLVMYKPRSARIDYKIQELLKNMKEVSLEIISYDDENKSIWEYIDGQDMIIPKEERDRLTSNNSEKPTSGIYSPEAFIKYFFEKDAQTRFLAQLTHLNDIFLCMHVSDLHGENMRLGKDAKIYAIDLEVIDGEQATLLMENSDIDVQAARRDAMLKFDFKVQRWIGTFHSEIGTHTKKFKIPIRRVLLNTEFLRETRTTDEPGQWTEDLSSDIITALKENGFKCDAKALIKRQTYKNILNGDVPFFTEMQGIVYYGYASDGFAIGRRG